MILPKIKNQNLSISVTLALTAMMLLWTAGCRRGVTFVPSAQQKPIDRSIIEVPAGYNIVVFAEGLTAPSAITFDSDGTLFIAESGIDGYEPRIFGKRTDGSILTIYPPAKRLNLPLFKTGFRIYGPIGGMVATAGRLYVTHRDAGNRGVVTAFDYEGGHETIVGDLPAQGDYSVTDIAVRPSDGRLFFGMGSATNSGVVGLDNFAIGWPRKNSEFCDQAYVDLKFNGFRFDSHNPRAGLFGGGNETAVTGAFQPFNISHQTRIRAAANGKPNAAIFSVAATGGDLQVEAHGIRMPAGIGFNEFGRPFATNQGMQLRGTRPVKDDPDAFVRILNGAYYGWPDYSADLTVISDARFQPGAQMIQKTGYQEINPLIDREASKLKVVDKDLALYGVFASQAGAEKFAFAPSSGPFKEFQGSAIVALSGDRAPFSTNGVKMIGPTGYKVVRVAVDDRQVSEFVVNTQRGPASRLRKKTVALERPVDVKFAPDGSMYILDMGVMRIKNGKPDVNRGTGKIFKLIPAEAPATQPE